MEIRKRNSNEDLSGYAELIKAPVPTQNMCICRDILSDPENQKIVLAGLRANVRGSRRSYSLSGHDLYLDDSRKSQELYDRLKAAFGLGEEENEKNKN